MRGTIPKLSPSDIQLMNHAKKRVQQINIFKLHFCIYFVASVCITVYLLFTGWTIWDILLILSWGLGVTLHGVIIRFTLSDIKVNVSDEYYRLKHSTMADNSKNSEETL